jgi:broad specificity phosphatase PhoE
VTTLTLIRHAEPQAWADNVVAGPRGDTGLSELGKRQAAALRDRFLAGRYSTDVVLTSVLPRAIETTEILLPALGGLAVIQHCDYCELHPGEADGLPWDEYSRRYGRVAPHVTPDVAFAPGGESLNDFALRVRRALGTVLSDHAGQHVTMVSHGGFISGVCLELLGASIDAPRDFLLAPTVTSITEWTATEERDALWRLERYNDAAHLEGSMMGT